MIADQLLAPLLDRLAGHPSRPFVYGICGAQGSGKSTVAELLQSELQNLGIGAATLSIDDLYLSGDQRGRLAREVHPLLRTRGVPGTHDLAPAFAVIRDAGRAGPVRLPRFDKARDEPCPAEAWPVAEGPIEVLLFEGWCVGAAPQTPEALALPVNALERDEDGDGRWRRWVNAQLEGPYRRLFARLDMLALIAAPGFGIVPDWRREQEHRLRQSLAARGLDGAGTMSDLEIDRFVQFFERITRHVLEEMPERADVVVRLDAFRRPIGSPP